VIVEPDRKVVQANPRRQAGSQPTQLMRSLPPQTEGVEELVVDVLHDLAYPCNPLPQALGPASLARVSFGRMDDLCSVALLPAAVVLEPFETLV